MSSSDRRAVLLSLAALAGCGFTPVYAPGGGGENLRGLIDVAAPADEEGYALVRRLEARLGVPRAARYGLVADIRVTEKAVGYLPDGTISRFSIDGQVDWSVTRLTGGETVLTGTERGFAGYSATSTQVATIYAERDARRRLMVMLADQIVSEILGNAELL